MGLPVGRSPLLSFVREVNGQEGRSAIRQSGPSRRRPVIRGYADHQPHQLAAAAATLAEVWEGLLSFSSLAMPLSAAAAATPAALPEGRPPRRRRRLRSGRGEGRCLPSGLPSSRLLLGHFFNRVSHACLEAGSQELLMLAGARITRPVTTTHHHRACFRFPQAGWRSPLRCLLPNNMAAVAVTG